MSRIRLRCLLAAAGLVVVLSLSAHRAIFGTCCGSIEQACVGESAEPSLRALSNRIPDAAVDSDPSNTLQKQPVEKSRPLGKRVSLNHAPGGQFDGITSACCGFTPNWVCSFLPESEFCTLLSRFRI